MQKTARAIIEYDNKFVFMKREKIKEGKLIIYYATIGGHLEENETFEEACLREIYEELGTNCKIDSLFLEYTNNDINTEEKYYLASILSGKIGSGKGEEFTNRDFEKYGSFEIAYIQKDEVKDINLLPENLKEKIIKELI